MLMPNGDVAALIKPQFEAGREQVGKKVSFAIEKYMKLL